MHLNPRDEGEACEPNTVGGHYNPYAQNVDNSSEMLIRTWQCIIWHATRTDYVIIYTYFAMQLQLE